MTTNRKGTFKPASARSKKAALAASGDESRQLDQGRSQVCDRGLHESTEPDSCVWCRCSCHYPRPLEQ